MATRLEPPSREDNGLWSLATACSAFRGTERHSSMSPTTESSGSPDSNASRNCRLPASPELNSSLHCNDADHFCHNDKQCGFEQTRIISPISPNEWSPASPSLTFSIPYNTTLPGTQHKTDRNSLACSQFQSSTNKPSKPAPLQNSRSLFPLLSTLSSNAESVYRTATPPHAPDEEQRRYVPTSKTSKKKSINGRKNQINKTRTAKSTDKTDSFETKLNEKNKELTKSYVGASGVIKPSKTKRTYKNEDRGKEHKVSHQKELAQHQSNNHAHDNGSSGVTTSDARTGSIFDDADAAQALLGLSGGFLAMQPPDLHFQLQMQESVTKPVGSALNCDGNRSRRVPRSFSETLNFDPQSSTSVQYSGDLHDAKLDMNSPAEENGGTLETPTEPMSPRKCVPESPTDQFPRFHFKKAICRKFAESLDRPNEDSSPRKGAETPAVEPVSTDPPLQNGVSRLNSQSTDPNETNTNRDCNENQTSRDIKRKKHKSITVNSNPQTNEKSNSVLRKPETKQTAKLSDKNLKNITPSNDATNTSHAKVTTLSEREGHDNTNNTKSNLYRISCSLGSSNESLNEQYDESEAGEESDSTSVYTSESEYEDLPSDTEDTEKSPPEQLDDGKLKKRQFTLSQPKFSLPARSNSSEPKAVFAGALQRTFGLKTPEVGSFTMSPPTISLPPRRSPTPEKSRSCFGAVHIRKATFTFSTKNEATSQSKQHHASRASTNARTAVLGKCPVRFNSSRNGLNSGENGWGASEEATTFGALSDGASFKTLSKEKDVEARTKDMTDDSWSSDHAGSSRVTYDKLRLPRSNARSPALEAQQMGKSKPGRKRKHGTSAKLEKKHLAKELGQDAEEIPIDTKDCVRACFHDKQTSQPHDSCRQDGLRSSKKSKETYAGACRIGPYHESTTDSTDTVTSRPSSRQSSLVGEEDISERRTNKRHRNSENLEKRKKRKKRHRSANPLTNAYEETRPHVSSVKQNRGFRLLSCFPAPPSLTAGLARGELLPSYGASVDHHCPRLPAKWQKGSDVLELKQKRQRERWRNMTLDMFCMGDVKI